MVSESALVCCPGSAGLAVLCVVTLWKDGGLPAPGSPLPDSY